mmetsp:Transcript_34354/g.90058  ORF Transcript_34354/g.90058 Transcript_34354/m.90058 type:complete len:252 (-) Transcript_34354:26-781(-)
MRWQSGGLMKSCSNSERKSWRTPATSGSCTRPGCRLYHSSSRSSETAIAPTVGRRSTSGDSECVLRLARPPRSRGTHPAAAPRTDSSAAEEMRRRHPESSAAKSSQPAQPRHPGFHLWRCRRSQLARRPWLRRPAWLCPYSRKALRISMATPRPRRSGPPLEPPHPRLLRRRATPAPTSQYPSCASRVKDGFLLACPPEQVPMLRHGQARYKVEPLRSHAPSHPSTYPPPPLDSVGPIFEPRIPSTGARVV